MWNLPRPVIEPMSPALAGQFLTTSEVPSASFHKCSMSTLKEGLVPCLRAYLCAQLNSTLRPCGRQTPRSMEFSRQEILKWVAISYSRGSYICEGRKPYQTPLLYPHQPRSASLRSRGMQALGSGRGRGRCWQKLLALCASVFLFGSNLQTVFP